MVALPSAALLEAPRFGPLTVTDLSELMRLALDLLLFLWQRFPRVQKTAVIWSCLVHQDVHGIATRTLIVWSGR